MVYWFHDDEMDIYKIYSDAEAAWDAVCVEVSQLSRPVQFNHLDACTLIDCFRDGKPVFQGDPSLMDYLDDDKIELPF
jgi:hypothetical protein